MSKKRSLLSLMLSALLVGAVGLTTLSCGSQPVTAGDKAGQATLGEEAAQTTSADRPVRVTPASSRRWTT